MIVSICCCEVSRVSSCRFCLGGLRGLIVLFCFRRFLGFRRFYLFVGGLRGSIVSIFVGRCPGLDRFGLFGRFPRFDRFGFVCELFLGRLLTMIVLNYLLNKARRKARHGMARQGKAKQGTAWQGWAGQCHKARQSRVRQGKA